MLNKEGDNGGVKRARRSQPVDQKECISVATISPRPVIVKILIFMRKKGHGAEPATACLRTNSTQTALRKVK